MQQKKWQSPEDIKLEINASIEKECIWRIRFFEKSEYAANDLNDSDKIDLISGDIVYLKN